MSPFGNVRNAVSRSLEQQNDPRDLHLDFPTPRIHGGWTGELSVIFLYSVGATLIYVPVVPARGGAEVALDLIVRPFSSIELACTVRQPGPCVNGGFARTCCTVVVQEHPRTWRARDHMPTQRQANTFFTLHTAPFTPRTSCFKLALHIPHFISSQKYLISSRLMSPHLNSSHLIPSLLTCHLTNSSSQLFSSYPSTEQSSSQLISALLQARKLLQTKKCCAHKAFAHRNLRHRCICTEKLWINTVHYKACTKSVPVLLCTTKLAQRTSPFYFVLQSLHKVLPSSTLYYQACTSSSQYYFVLQSLHKALPSSTLYYKACTKYAPVLLCTTRLSQVRPSTTLYYETFTSTSQYYLYYKACTKHVPVLLCTTKLAQSFYYQACTKHVPVLLCTTKLV